MSGIGGDFFAAISRYTLPIQLKLNCVENGVLNGWKKLWLIFPLQMMLSRAALAVALKWRRCCPNNSIVYSVAISSYPSPGACSQQSPARDPQRIVALFNVRMIVYQKWSLVPQTASGLIPELPKFCHFPNIFGKLLLPSCTLNGISYKV